MGRTLYRIRALVSFGRVTAGDLGGFVEKADNLSHEGNAWVAGNAWVEGNARVAGDAQKTPIHIAGLAYPVTIADTLIIIGCQRHTTGEWATFDDRAIAAMDGLAATRFWRDHKGAILALARVHQGVGLPAPVAVAAE